MAGYNDVIILESYLVHKSDGDEASCKSKKRWWQGDASTSEAKGYLVKTEMNKYALKVNWSKNNVCTHQLPSPGTAIILRHNTDSKWMSLCIANIIDVLPDCKKNLVSLVISFSNPGSFRKWEEELRKSLKVYSCNVEIKKNQIIQDGPAIIHVTSEFLYITALAKTGRYKGLYCKSRRKSKISCYSDESRQTHYLAIESQNGSKEKIEFSSQNISVIKKSLFYFENLSIKTAQQTSTENGLVQTFRSCCKKVAKGESSCATTERKQSYESIKSIKDGILLNENVASENSGYSFCDSPSRPKGPCLYSFVDVKCKEDAIKQENVEGTYVKFTDFQQLDKIQHEIKTGKSYDEMGKPKKTLSSSFTKSPSYTSLTKEAQSDCFDFKELQTPSSYTEKTNTRYVNEIGVIPESFSGNSLPISCDVIPRGGSPYPITQQDNSIMQHEFTESLPKSTSVDATTEDVIPRSRPMSKIEIYKCTDQPLFLYRSFEQENAVSLPVCPQNQISSMTFRDPESDSPPRSPKPPKSATLENWTPKFISQTLPSSNEQLPPPLLKREHSCSLHPENHVYQNASSLRSANSSAESNSPIELLVHVFAEGMGHGGAWTIGVLLVKNEDPETTFKKVQDLEKFVFGRTQLKTPRLLDAKSDIVISIKGCSSGFEVMNQTSQVIVYADLQQLGPMRWITTEFQFTHSNEDASIFQCDLIIEPTTIQNESGKSRFCSLEIPILSKFSRSGTPPRVILGMNTRNRQNFCLDLDIPAALGNDWKEFAARVGLETRDIRIITHSKCASYTEEVLQILESSYPEKCNTEYLKSILREMKRLDLVEYFD